MNAAAPISPTRIEPLRRTGIFTQVYRRGRWGRGTQISIGVLPNGSPVTRIGLRTRKGLKGAVVRNRLKRQMRAILHHQHQGISRGLDLVIVIHPALTRPTSQQLSSELAILCKRLGIRS